MRAFIRWLTMVPVTWLTVSLAACTVQTPEPAAGHGALALALRQTVASGSAYRLQGASLRIAGNASDLTVTPSDDDEVFRTELPAGDYTLELQPGWRLERERDQTDQADSADSADSQWSPVAATLASDNPQSFAIAAGAITSLALRFAVQDETDVELATGTLAVQLQVAGAGGDASGTAAGAMAGTTGTSQPACGAGLVINEIDYDQEGSDSSELIELYNAGPCALATAELALVLRNGGAAGAPAYATIALDPVGAEIASGAYLVVAAAAVIAELPAGTLALGPTSFSLQNGPDAVELRAGGTILDAVAYGGVVAGSGEGAPSPADRGPGALGRCPNGADSADNAADLSLLETPTPGSANACP
ncbi:MAG TPA: lamin tail domain-containing protein [Polyangiales bacterium]|nr:lamin tail domain-containing protein [Polyangiales bacterium]